MKKLKFFKTYEIISHLAIGLIVVLFCSQSIEAQEEKSHNLEKVKNASLFADIGGQLHGIAFDDQNSMYVGKNGKEILKISPEAKITSFAVIEGATGSYVDGPGDTYIYDMEFGQDGNLYVAAEDRILKINRNGHIITLLKQNFEGRWGACGIAIDNKGNVFVAFDNKILRIQTNSEKSIYIDRQKIGFDLEALVGLEFDADNKNLYICDGKMGRTGQIIQIPIKADGSPGKAKVILKKAGYRPEYLSMHPDNDIVVNGPDNSNFILLKKGRAPLVIKLEAPEVGEMATIAFGRNGFKRKSIYGTGWFDGKIYRIDF